MLRPARATDAPEIASIMRAALASFDWMPVVHTPEEDLAFISGVVLPSREVTVATVPGGVVGFVAARPDWIDQLYLDPAWTGRGIGGRLLEQATAGIAETRLYCFQANTGARRFYEGHGFAAEAFGDGSGNEEQLPDIFYVRRR